MDPQGAWHPWCPPIDQPMTTISIMLLKPFCRVSGSGEDLMSLERGWSRCLRKEQCTNTAAILPHGPRNKCRVVYECYCNVLEFLLSCHCGNKSKCYENYLLNNEYFELTRFLTLALKYGIFSGIS